MVKRKTSCYHQFSFLFCSTIKDGSRRVEFDVILVCASDMVLPCLRGQSTRYPDCYIALTETSKYDMYYVFMNEFF